MIIVSEPAPQIILGEDTLNPISILPASEEGSGYHIWDMRHATLEYRCDSRGIEIAVKYKKTTVSLPVSPELASIKPYLCGPMQNSKKYIVRRFTRAIAH